MKGRPRKPTKLLVMTGRAKHDPQRLRERENEPTDIPDLGNPPQHLTEDQKKAWEYIASCCPDGVLKESDRPALELAARHYAAVCAGQAQPWQWKQLDSILGRFGMTPAERSKVSVGPKKKTNKFEGIGG